MERFVLYDTKGNVNWYRCTICGALSRGKPDICPICHSKPKETVISDNSGGKSLDDKLSEFKKILDKYQIL